MIKQFNKEALEEIIEDMTGFVETSQDKIFYISDESIKEHTYLQSELAQIKTKVLDIIKYGDELEVKVKKSRQHLALVSKEFDRYTERDIREVYEKTHNLQTNLIMVRQEEKTLRQKRDDIERRLIRLNKTIEYAEEVGQKVSVVLTYLKDDFSQVNEALKSAKEQQQLGLKIIEAQEFERKRLSREIHDGPAQMLAHILIRSEVVDLAVRDGKLETVLDEIKTIRGNIRDSLKEVRRIIYDLRPMALDDLGLFPTIKKYVTTLTNNKLAVDLVLKGNDQPLQSNYEIVIFRLVQEAVQNMMKHAKASKARVHIHIKEEEITILIEDDGIGFKTNDTPQRENSFGLIGMRERVELLDGTISIESEENRGTKIGIILPYITL